MLRRTLRIGALRQKLRNFPYLLQRACLCSVAACPRAVVLVKMPRLMADLLKNCFTRVERLVKIIYQDVPPPFFFARGCTEWRYKWVNSHWPILRPITGRNVYTLSSVQSSLRARCVVVREMNSSLLSCICGSKAVPESRPKHRRRAGQSCAMRCDAAVRSCGNVVVLRYSRLS